LKYDTGATFFIEKIYEIVKEKSKQSFSDCALTIAADIGNISEKVKKNTRTLHQKNLYSKLHLFFEFTIIIPTMLVSR